MFQRYLNNPQLKFLKQIKKEFLNSEIFLVGGSVRNIMLKKTIKDYDFVIRKVRAINLQKFLEKIGRVDLVGKNFGIFKFRPFSLKKILIENPPSKLKFNSKIEIDIALPRTEAGWGTGIHQDFTVQSNPNLKITEDLKRRDFTVNAIAYDIFKKKIIDPFGGQKDLKRKIIRAVLNPAERFQEDLSRVIRAIRFASVLNFKIEKKTWQAVKMLSKKINQVPKELVSLELKKMLESFPSKALNLLTESKILEIFWPEIIAMKGCIQPENYHSEGDVWEHTKLAISVLEKKHKKRPLDIELVLAVLFHDLGKPLTRRVEKKISADAVKFLTNQIADRNSILQQAKKITFKEHDIKGAELFSQIAKRLKLENSGIDIGEVKFLIRSHMLLFSGDPAKMKNTTLEKYFLKNKKQGDNLLKLIEIDTQATIPEKGEQNISRLSIIKKRLAQIKNLSQNKKQAPQPLLDGGEVMKVLKIQPSPQVGQILRNLREAQLSNKVRTKAGAKKWIICQASKSLL